MNRALGAVKMLDEGQKAAFVEELMAFLRALVFDGNLHAAIEECQLTQPLRQNIETELAHLKDLGIRLEGHLRAALLRFPDLLQRRLRIAAPVTLLVDLTVALDFDFQSFRQRVDHGYADAVQPAGNFVGIFVEFAAGVKFGQYHFGRGDLFSGVDIDRNTAPVVDDRDAVIDVNFDLNGIAMAGQRFIDGVVDNFEDKMMQSALASVADIHAGTFAHRFQAFQNFDVFGAIFRIWWIFYVSHFHPSSNYKFCEKNSGVRQNFS